MKVRSVSCSNLGQNGPSWSLSWWEGSLVLYVAVPLALAGLGTSPMPWCGSRQWQCHIAGGCEVVD